MNRNFSVANREENALTLHSLLDFESVNRTTFGEKFERNDEVWLERLVEQMISIVVPSAAGRY